MERGRRRNSQHPLADASHDTPREAPRQLLRALHDGHAIVLHTGVRMHSLVFKAQTNDEADAIRDTPLCINAHLQVRRQHVTCHRADLGRHRGWHRSPDGIAETEVVSQLIKQATVRLCPCKKGSQQGQESRVGNHSFSHTIRILSIHKVEPTAPTKRSPRRLEEKTIAKL